jgi:2C-methyl-D-erythritol 2,4-cyclodiphosphate synthase
MIIIIEYTLSDADAVMLAFYDDILGAVTIENMFFDRVIFKTSSGFKIIGNVLELLKQTYSPKEPDVYSKGDNNFVHLFCF